MRNYSAIVEVNHLSYSINAGEYQQSVSIKAVLRDLAKAFETPLSLVQADFDLLTRLGDPCGCRCCPSEVAVLVELYEFQIEVLNWSVWDMQTRAFVYINLNTGAKVVWTHVGC